MADFMEMVEKAREKYERLPLSEKIAHDYAQRRSFVRGMCPDSTDFETWCTAVDKVLPPVMVGTAAQALRAEKQYALDSLHAAEVEIARLSKRLRQAEASLSTWDDHLDSRYWSEYPDAKEAIAALGQSPLSAKEE